MATNQYILVDGKPVMEPDIVRWGEWMEDIERRVVAKDSFMGGEIEVSTIFMGIDHSFGGDYPILYETMVFGVEEGECEELEDYQARYRSRTASLLGHARACRLVESFIGGKPDPESDLYKGKRTGWASWKL